MKNYVSPNWPAPKNIKAVTTTRLHDFNLALHVNDDPRHVSKNRETLKNDLNLPSSPLWLKQTHSCIVIHAKNHQKNIEADACYTHQENKVCAVMTADCLPLLICNKQGTEVAAIHAGWRGLASHIIKNTVEQFRSPPKDLLVWLGPAIGPHAFEVGNEVKTAFKKQADAFKPFGDKYLCDIYRLAEIELNQLGISAIYGGDHCTFSETKQFYSYRRDGQTGRMVSLIWL